MKRFIVSGVVLALMAGSACAGPVADFEKALRGAYGDYRKALFLTNSGKAAESGQAISSFITKWGDIAKSHGATPPPQYADDAQWPSTLADVSATAAAAASEIKAGDLVKAHDTLEAVRDAIGGLHARNGIIAFSDRMNAYHAKMEEVLGRGASGGDFDTLIGDAAVLQYLAEQAIANPPPEALGAKDFEALAGAMTASSSALSEAARSRDPAKVKAALGAMKPAYSKLFMKFG